MRISQADYDQLPSSMRSQFRQDGDQWVAITYANAVAESERHRTQQQQTQQQLEAFSGINPDDADYLRQALDNRNRQLIEQATKSGGVDQLIADRVAQAVAPLQKNLDSANRQIADYRERHVDAAFERQLGEAYRAAGLDPQYQDLVLATARGARNTTETNGDVAFDFGGMDITGFIQAQADRYPVFRGQTDSQGARGNRGPSFSGNNPWNPQSPDFGAQRRMLTSNRQEAEQMMRAVNYNPATGAYENEGGR